LWQVVAIVHRCAPDLAQSLIQTALDHAGRGPQHRRRIVAYLRQHPDAITSGSSRAPRIVGRFIAELAAAGAGVAIPRCAGCGQPRDLPHIRGPNRICTSCYDRSHTAVCADCGKEGRVHGRTDDGKPRCSPCRERAKVGVCDRCGRTRPIKRSAEDGMAYCRGCRARNALEPCGGCGNLRPVNLRLPHGTARCVTCYAAHHAPRRTCEKCGAVGPANVRAGGRTDGEQTLCERCYRHPRRVCGVCGRIRRVAVKADANRPDMCPTCYQAPTEICSVCGLLALCRRTTQTREPICFRCQLARRLDQLLTGPSGDALPALLPLRDAVMSVTSPRTGLGWVQSSSGAHLLARIAAGELPLSHDTLDAEPPSMSVEHLRRMLVAAGALNERDEQLARLQQHLLQARSARCGGDARAVLNGLAVAGRPLPEDMLGEVTCLDPDTVRAAVGDLAAARLLAAPLGAAHRPRHALLAEAVAAELLPGERVSLHERIARTLETAGGETLAAEAAGHWAAAGRTSEELRARLAAARAAEQVFAYADAAAHWQRAIELCQAEPSADLSDGIDMAHLYMRAADALEASGDGVQAGMIAEEAYRRFADHPDPATAAVIHLRAAAYRGHDSPAAGLPLIKEGLRLFEATPPSTEHAQAWVTYASDFLLHAEGRRPAETLAALDRALEVAEAAGAATQIPRILCERAYQAFLHGEVEDGFGLLARAQSEPGASRDASAALELAEIESDALLKVGKLEAATLVGQRGLEVALQGGLGSSWGAAILHLNAVEGLLGRGRTAEDAALIDPHTAGPVDRDHWPLHLCRAEIDLLRGQVDAAAQRLHLFEIPSSLDFSRELGQRAAEVALWAGRPAKALEEIRRVFERLEETEWVILSGWLLVVGMRACADLAERGRARREDDAVRGALAAADDLAASVKRAHEVPFTDHPFVASIPAARATWNAEHGRATGASNPDAWDVAAEHWEALDYRHRAGYARWRQAEVLLATPHSGRGAAASVLSTAAGLAVEHVPLTTAIQDLARRARIDLATVASTVARSSPRPRTHSG
jgi:tetratricopeptide (TPR) repeat protein